jgi:hypothetical protein
MIWIMPCECEILAVQSQSYQRGRHCGEPPVTAKVNNLPVLGQVSVLPHNTSVERTTSGSRPKVKAIPL